MGELREIPFDFEILDQFETLMRSADNEHLAHAKLVSDGTTEVNCSCGSHWRHRANAEDKELQDTFGAHLSYFNKPKTLVL